MIIGVGSNLLKVNTQEFGYLKKYMDNPDILLTRNELNQFYSSSSMVNYIAKILSAKESFLSAVSCSYDVKFTPYLDIEVVYDDIGKPEFLFYRNILNFIESRNMSILLSISYYYDLIFSMVLIF